MDFLSRRKRAGQADTTSSDEKRRDFERLAMPLIDPLFNFARWSTRNTQEAEDLVQETYMIAMRMRETSLKTALKAAPLGTLLKVSSPRGSFTLHKDSTRPAVFLAGGIGITPIRSILQSAIRGGAPHQVYLFYSNHTSQDVSFLEELEELATQSQSFVLVPTITQSDNATWPYEKGRIDQKLLAKFLPEFRGPIYYVAGPSGLVAAMSNLLSECGVSEDDIRTEESELTDARGLNPSSLVPELHSAAANQLQKKARITTMTQEIGKARESCGTTLPRIRSRHSTKRPRS